MIDDRKLSPHFSLYEMIRSPIAARRNIDNTPSDAEIANLIVLCDRILEPVRSLLGVPIIVTSGYRSKILNLVIGGSYTSQHMTGQAADIGTMNLADLEIVERIRHADSIRYDQLILEFPPNGWVHVSWSASPRRQVLLAHAGDRGTVYESF